MRVQKPYQVDIVGENQQLPAAACPWARRFVEDINSLADEGDQAYSMIQDFDSSPFDLFQDPDLTDWFLRLDVKCLRCLLYTSPSPRDRSLS
eukprot:2978338-Pyramimonas_sp.AAC.1